MNSDCCPQDIIFMKRSTYYYLQLWNYHPVLGQWTQLSFSDLESWDCLVYASMPPVKKKQTHMEEPPYNILNLRFPFTKWSVFVALIQLIIPIVDFHIWVFLNYLSKSSNSLKNMYMEMHTWNLYSCLQKVSDTDVLGHRACCSVL